MLHLIGGSETRFRLKADSGGIALVLDQHEFARAKHGAISGIGLIQLATLRMLEEQGLAEEIANGYYLLSEAATQLDSEIREQLALPEPWPGFIRVNCSGSTFEPRFSLALSLHRHDGADAGRYELQGPLIHMSEAEAYLASFAQWQALSAAQQHRELARSAGGASEVENLKAIHAIQTAHTSDAEIDLGPFKELEVEWPERVGVAVVGTDDGGLELIPSFNGQDDPELTRRRLRQIKDREEGSIRIGGRIVILDRERMRAVREIVENRRIPPDQARAFLKNPAAFIDAALVDLDLGFSIRVKGATRFRLAYFGETEGSEIDWFAAPEPGTKVDFGPAGARQLIKDFADLQRFEEMFETAVKAGAREFRWADEVLFQFDEADRVRGELLAIRRELEQEATAGTGQGGNTGGDGETLEDQDAEPDTGPAVVDIDEHDEDGATLEVVPSSWLEVLDTSVLNTENLQLNAYSYQEQGIRWILGLARESFRHESQDKLLGSLLADDMGLGKTFMALAAIEQYFIRCEASGETARPALVVAPLSLLENWKDEVRKVFHRSPFHDVVVLQTDADLHHFRRPDGRRETDQSSEVLSEAGRDGLAKIRYSLFVGDEDPTHRLDLPRRLVLTSYQTLRDYQFSLSRVDWSFVVFDEAQNIKNPNALQTRAAKALKAKYRLVVTGTPVENELRDFWCLFDTARPTVLGAYQAFRQTYVKPILNADDETRGQVRQEVGKELRKRVGGLMLRRLKEENLEGLPTKTVRVGVNTHSTGEVYAPELAAEMPAEQLERYEAVIAGVRIALESDDSQGAALSGLHHLRAVSLHPDCLAGGMPAIGGNSRKFEAELRRSGKLAKLLDILGDVQARKEKVIVFCINKRLQAFLQIGLSTLYDVPVHVINGDTAAVAKKETGVTRKRLIADFEDRKGFGVIVMSPIAAGVGLTVVGANNVIHLERHWNPAKESQATDRVYRIGQEMPVNIYVPILHHPTLESFDVNLAKLLAKKASLRDAIVTPDVVTPDELIRGGLFGGESSVTGSSIGLDRVDTMSWDYFEALVGILLQKELGATVFLTGRNDKGCDVVVLPPTAAARLVQCKHTLTRRLKGYTAITEIVGAKPIYERLTGRSVGVLEVITNARSYDREARSTAADCGVELRDRADLRKLLSRHSVTDNDVLALLEAPRLGSRKRL